MKDHISLQAVRRPLRRCLAKHPAVLAAYAFGSMVKGTARRSADWDLSSDLDLGILVDPELTKGRRWDLRWALYTDLVSAVKQEVDPIVLNDASLGLVHEILRTGHRIYERPGRRHRREEAELLSQALDFLPTKQWIEQRIIQHLKAGHG